MINGNPKILPSSTTALPAMPNHEKLPALNSKEAGGTGVGKEYKDSANNSANVMWRAKVKGRKMLADNIPLHMSLKTFDKPHELPIDEVKQKAQELGIQRPDPAKLKYEPTIFTSQRNGKTYYMLKLHGTDPSYDKFAEHFKGRGITYPNYMGHITIDKELHDQIKKEGIKPHEVEFSPLMIEHGANNPTHIIPDSKSHQDHKSDITPKKLNPESFKDPKKLAASECIYSDLQKAYCEHLSLNKPIKKSLFHNMGATAAMIGALSGTPNIAQTPNQPKQQVQPSVYSSDKMLNAISQVESSGGKNTNHAMLHDKTNAGERAYGKFGLTPSIIRETISMDPNLKRDHAKAVNLHGQDMEHYMQDNPNLEQSVAVRHLNRLEHHFGKDPGKIGLSWLEGIAGANKMLKRGVNPKNHWHSKKVIHEYNKVK